MVMQTDEWTFDIDPYDVYGIPAENPAEQEDTIRAEEAQSENATFFDWLNAVAYTTESIADAWRAVFDDDEVEKTREERAATQYQKPQYQNPITEFISETGGLTLLLLIIGGFIVYRMAD